MICHPPSTYEILLINATTAWSRRLHVRECCGFIDGRARLPVSVLLRGLNGCTAVMYVRGSLCDICIMALRFGGVGNANLVYSHIGAVCENVYELLPIVQSAL